MHHPVPVREGVLDVNTTIAKANRRRLRARGR